MSQYNYDVFISYSRTRMIAPWVSKFFLAHFREWLHEKLLFLKVDLNGKEPRIFFDKTDIMPGTPWPQKLKDAAKTSKVLVAICSPTYFDSEWCKSEWATFAERERIIGATGLRIPVRHNDCEHFLGDIQWSDFYGYTFLTEGFYQSSQAIIFEQRIENLALAVAQAIKDAPPYDDDWPTLIVPSSSQTVLMHRL